MNKKILGLDLGVTSIGWALISENSEEGKKIIDMGSRIIPISSDDKDEFTKGNAISKNQKRTEKRTQRKGYDRYQLRRKDLKELLLKYNMFPNEELIKLPAIELYGLREKALKSKIELQELGRIFYHLNQKRGYKSSRNDANKDKKETDYVAEVKNRHQLIQEKNQTVGQHFYSELKINEYYRIKQQVFPREAYVEEFNKICDMQRRFHSVLSEELIAIFRDEIIYYQRKLKSQKGLVSICEFEGELRKDIKGKEVFTGPKVIHRSNPLFQICKIWESINSIALKNKRGEIFAISIEQKRQLFEYLDKNKILTQAELFKILGLSKNDGWYGNKQIAKGIQGNITKVAIIEYLKKYPELIKFEILIDNGLDEVYLVDKKTGEVLLNNTKKTVQKTFEKQTYYRLWHCIYSISDTQECSKTLQKNFGLSADIAENLAALDFVKFGFGNKSAKSIRKILPYLIEGFVFSDACSFAGYNHSNSLTNDENYKRQLLTSLPNLAKNSLRQPIVEKILNQLINVVNAIIEKHGSFGKDDEIRIELARELKQSKDERNESFSNQTKRERENKLIIERIEEEYKQYGVRASRNTIIKWRLFHEIDNEESKVNATCIYCGQPFGFTDALLGSNVDIEHIIPKSRLFDDSQSNKTLSHRKCNEDKGDRTAFDFMQSKGSERLTQYIETVESLFKNRIIGKAKRDKLLMPGDKIPQDFIDRQLRETQYISKKSKEILQKVCFNVWSSSGNVTSYLRRIWGWDDVLMNLQLPKYREMGMTEWKEWETNDGQQHKKEIVTGWTKRDDHRHHAIDALTIACTKQGFIQRINTLNASGTRDSMKREIEDSKVEYDKRKSLMENYFFDQRPFTTNEIELSASNIIISFKAGKKISSIGNRKIKVNGKKSIVQSGIIIPRGPLSEEKVYGKIQGIVKNKPIKYLFENVDLIFKPYIKDLVIQRIEAFEGDIKKAFASIKKEPIYLDESKKIPLEFGTCFKEEYVIKYSISEIKSSDISSIVDLKIREIIKNRLAKFNNREKEAFKDLDKNPVWFNEAKRIPIKTVRMYTGLNVVEPVKRDEHGKDIGYVKPGNNHHVSIYIDQLGKMHESICSFWHAVERKKFNIPVIIRNPKEVWDKILSERLKYPETFLEKLPKDNWKLIESLQQNEMFILGLGEKHEKTDLLKLDKSFLSDYLFRVQKISSNEYFFRHHLETSVSKDTDLKLEGRKRDAKRYYISNSIGSFLNLNPVKVIINNLGEIKLI